MHSRRLFLALAGTATAAVSGCLDAFEDEEDPEDDTGIEITDVEQNEDASGDPIVSVFYESGIDAERALTVTLSRDGDVVREITEPRPISAGERSLSVDFLTAAFDDVDVDLTDLDVPDPDTTDDDVVDTETVPPEDAGGPGVDTDYETGELLVEFTPPEGADAVDVSVHLYMESDGWVDHGYDRTITEPVAVEGSEMTHAVDIRPPEIFADYAVEVQPR